jgi:hypothetical protein
MDVMPEVRLEWKTCDYRFSHMVEKLSRSPAYVPPDYQLSSEIREWCNSELKGDWSYSRLGVILFELENDAIFFKLRWL